jgi:hypothetical protein
MSFNQNSGTAVPTLINSSSVLVTGNAVSSNALTVRQFGTGNVFSAQTTTGSTALFVGANGNVGVGTTSPQTALDVFTGTMNAATVVATTHYGAIAGSNTVSASTFTGAGSGITALNMDNAGSGTLAVARGGTGTTSSTGTGSVVLSAGPTLSGTVTGGTFSGTHTGDGSGITSLNMGNAGSGTLAVARGGTGVTSSTGTGSVVLSASPALSGTATFASITTSGNVGIGAASPAYSLDVNGSIQTSGSIIMTGQSSGSITAQRSAIWWAATNDWNHVLYNNYLNRDGLGAFDGMRWMLYSGIQFYCGGRLGASLAGLSLCINSSGNVGIGITNPPDNLTVAANFGATFGCYRISYTDWTFKVKVASGSITTANDALDSMVIVGAGSSTNRSISARGTINGSGTDYAEYMAKSGDFTIKKGDIVGVNSQGLLTNVFTESVSFVVKSTDPSYVGGDVWADSFAEIKPKEVKEEEPGYAEYQTALAQFNAKLEEARVRVDRIAFAGQVPVNVLGATPGQYIIPIANDDGSIGGQAVSNPTFEQYMAAVGKVINVLPDGRAQIIVKVV